MGATLVGVSLLPELFARLNAWIAAQPEPRPGRPEAIRRLIAASLADTPPAG
jgi:hypothetical protein